MDISRQRCSIEASKSIDFYTDELKLGVILMQDQTPMPAVWYGVCAIKNRALVHQIGSSSLNHASIGTQAAIQICYNHNLETPAPFRADVWETKDSDFVFCSIQPENYGDVWQLKDQRLSISYVPTISELDQNGVHQVLQANVLEITLTKTPLCEECVLVDPESFNVAIEPHNYLVAYSEILSSLQKPHLKRYTPTPPVLREGDMLSALTANKVSGCAIYRNGQTSKDGFVIVFDDPNFKPLCSLELSEETAGALVTGLLDALNI